MVTLRQRLLLVAGWLTAAVGAGLVASGAVAVAGGQVLDRPLRPMTAAEVAALPVVEVGAPDVVEPHASGGPDTVAGGPAQGSDDAEGLGDPVGAGGSSATDDGAPESDVDVAPPAASPPQDPITSEATAIVEIESVEGGQASFALAEGSLLLLWATPRSGYVASTRLVSDERITVAFSSSRRVWVIDATFSDAGVDEGIVVVSRPEPIA